MCQLTVFGRVDSINAVTEKSDRQCVGVERTLMCRGIDTLREAADNAKPRFAEMLCKFVRVLPTAASWIATANNSERR